MLARIRSLLGNGATRYQCRIDAGCLAVRAHHIFVAFISFAVLSICYEKTLLQPELGPLRNSWTVRRWFQQAQEPIRIPSDPDPVIETTGQAGRTPSDRKKIRRPRRKAHISS